MKITEADRWFGKCVKERAEWTCESCHKQYQEGDQGIHTSHFWSRRYKSVRHDPDNAAAHCFGCHQRLGGNPLEFSVWVSAYLGKERMRALQLRKNQTLKISQYESFICAHYKAQYRFMKELRAKGVTGYLPFVSWAP